MAANRRNEKELWRKQTDDGSLKTKPIFPQGRWRAQPQIGLCKTKPIRWSGSVPSRSRWREFGPCPRGAGVPARLRKTSCGDARPTKRRLVASLRTGFLLPAGWAGVFSAVKAEWSAMEIKIESLLEGAGRAQGTVVIVDVFRAFTTAAVALARGAERIIMVPGIEEALRLRDQGVGAVCVGEVNGIKPEGFDFGNSPHEMMQASLAGKVVIQSTRAGTTGVAAATQAEAVYAGAFVVAAATAEALRRDGPPQVTIVAMGWNARVRTDEDELCALYLRNLLQGRRPDPEAVRKLVRAGGEATKFGDPQQPHFHREDLEIALEINKYDFAIRVVKEDGFLVARRHG
jgi:2-phosphosulfolactate phosphatase